MDKLTVLFIRACKANDPDKRLRSIYRRFFLSTHSEAQYLSCVASRLVDICDTYLDKNANYLLDALSPGNDWKYAPELGAETVLVRSEQNPTVLYLTKMCKVLVSRIRFASVDSFLGLPKPARFRRAYA